MERAKGIEPSYAAWEAVFLPSQLAPYCFKFTSNSLRLHTNSAHGFSSSTVSKRAPLRLIGEYNARNSLHRSVVIETILGKTDSLRLRRPAQLRHYRRQTQEDLFC